MLKSRSVRHQFTVLTAANIFTRALGFVLRVMLSRLLGAQAMGIMELSHSAHMLSIAPVTAGLPLAVSRMTARDKNDAALRAGRRLILLSSLVCVPLWLLLSPVMAYIMHDLRVLPSLWAFTPCIVILGLSAIYNGYCYGLGNAFPPALSEILEQMLRFLLSAALLLSLPQLTQAGRAAVPALATAIAEAAGLLLVCRMVRSAAPSAPVQALPAAQREIVRLSLPLTFSRILTTLLRTASGVLIPLRLTASGLSHAAATEMLGMLQGMVMPVLFLPGVVTGALGTVGTSAIAARQGSGRRRMTTLLFLSALGCGLLGMLSIRLLSGILSDYLYHLPALQPLFVRAAPLTLFFALQHAANGVLSGLGEQKRTLLPALAGAGISLFFLYIRAAQPHLRILGAIDAMILGQAVTLVWTLILLYLRIRPAKKG